MRMLPITVTHVLQMRFSSTGEEGRGRHPHRIASHAGHVWETLDRHVLSARGATEIHSSPLPTHAVMPCPN